MAARRNRVPFRTVRFVAAQGFSAHSRADGFENRAPLSGRREAAGHGGKPADRPRARGTGVEQRSAAALRTVPMVRIRKAHHGADEAGPRVMVWSSTSGRSSRSTTVGFAGGGHRWRGRFSTSLQRAGGFGIGGDPGDQLDADCRPVTSQDLVGRQLPDPAADEADHEVAAPGDRATGRRVRPGRLRPGAGLRCRRALAPSSPLAGARRAGRRRRAAAPAGRPTCSGSEVTAITRASTCTAISIAAAPPRSS